MTPFSQNPSGHSGPFRVDLRSASASCSWSLIPFSEGAIGNTDSGSPRFAAPVLHSSHGSLKCG